MGTSVEHVPEIEPVGDSEVEFLTKQIQLLPPVFAHDWAKAESQDQGGTIALIGPRVEEWWISSDIQQGLLRRVRAQSTSCPFGFAADDSPENSVIVEGLLAVQDAAAVLEGLIAAVLPRHT